MAGPPLGILLGALNVLVIGTGMAAIYGEAGIVVWVLIFGIVPGFMLGGLLGWLADAMKPLPIWVRRFVLVVPAVLLVVVLAAQFSMQSFIVLSCIPTAVATLLLERATREVIPPPVPVAHARRTS